MRMLQYIPVGAGLVALSLVVVGQYHSAQRELIRSEEAYVQTTCDRARGTATQTAWAQCYDVQRHTRTEYLCTAYARRCWVEVK